MQKLRAEKGITLIALIITIIVMLILVGVSVTVALNGGLFSTAKEAAEGTAAKRDEELNLSDGKVEINGEWYNSIDEYVNGSGNGTGGEVTLPTGWEVTTKPEAWTSNKVTAIKETATGNIVALPEGYSISEVAEEQTVDEGLVITDGTNEFVWIPVTTDFTATYNYSSSYSEPTELTAEIYDWDMGEELIFETTDSQETLNGLYGEGYYDYTSTFAYSVHYSEMVESVNKYDGFYIGRYETTIDGQNIGSKAGATVLSANAILKDGTSSVDLDLDGENEPFYYRWWGLYASQRNSNVAGNGNTVQTNMIWGQQWDAIITYFGSKDYSNTPVKTLATEKKVQNAGQAKYTYNSEEISDEICNIFDLRGNTYDWTAEANLTSFRAYRGGGYYGRVSASYRNDFVSPDYYYDYLGSRLSLYIK